MADAKVRSLFAEKHPKPKRGRSTVEEPAERNRIKRGQSTTPGVYAERSAKGSTIFRIRWSPEVGVGGVGGSTFEVVNPKTGKKESLREDRFCGDSSAAVLARAQACQWVFDDLEKRRGLRDEGETLASRSVDYLARLCDSTLAVHVDPRLVARVLDYAHEMLVLDTTGAVREASRTLLSLCVLHAWTPEIKRLAKAGEDLPALANELRLQPKRKRGTMSPARMMQHINNHRRFVHWCYSPSAVWRDDYGTRRIGRLTSPRSLDTEVLEAFAASLKAGTRTAISTRGVDVTTIRQWLTRLEARERPRLSDRAIADAMPVPERPKGRGVDTTRRDEGEPVMYSPTQLQAIIKSGIALDDEREAPFLDPTMRIWLGGPTALQLLFWTAFGNRVCELKDDPFGDFSIEITDTRVTLVTAKTGKHRHLLSDYAPVTFEAIAAQREFDKALRGHGFRENPKALIYAPSPYALGSSGVTVAQTSKRLIELGAPSKGRWRFTPKSLRSTLGSYLCVATGISQGAAGSIDFAASLLGNTPGTITSSYRAEHIRPILMEAKVDFTAPDIEQLMQIQDIARTVRDRILRRIDRIPEVLRVAEERARIRKLKVNSTRNRYERRQRAIAKANAAGQAQRRAKS